MFGQELTTMIKLLEKVFVELQASNKTQKELLEAVRENTKISKLLASQALAKTDGAPADGEQSDGNHYLGDGSSSQKGSSEPKTEGPGDCRSKCNGRCDNDDAAKPAHSDCEPTCG